MRQAAISDRQFVSTPISEPSRTSVVGPSVLSSEFDIAQECEKMVGTLSTIYIFAMKTYPNKSEFDDDHEQTGGPAERRDNNIYKFRKVGFYELIS